MYHLFKKMIFFARIKNRIKIRVRFSLSHWWQRGQLHYRLKTAYGQWILTKVHEENRVLREIQHPKIIEFSIS